MPELKPYGRQAVRMEAEPGVPAAGDSSLGGPLLWPRTDPCRPAPSRTTPSNAVPGGKDLITRLSGWKVGGWPTWHLTSPMTFDCPDHHQEIHADLH